MRGAIAGLVSPSPLGDTLPSVLREDAFARGLCAGLDEVLAPVMLSLDAFEAYLDLDTTPDDMLPWLAQWLGLVLDTDRGPDTQRDLLRSAGELHATRGTRRGIELAVTAGLGLSVEVTETGAATWSATPGGDLPGQPGATLEVVVRTAPGQEVDIDRVEALVASVKPAHVRHRVRILAAPGPDPAAR